MKCHLFRIVVHDWGVGDIEGVRARDAAEHTTVSMIPPTESDLAPVSGGPKVGTLLRPVVLRLFKLGPVRTTHLPDIFKWNSSHWLEFAR